MENDYLNLLASIVLLTRILDYFSIVGVYPRILWKYTSFGLKDVSGIKQYVHFKSNGFIEAVSVTDFPIRDHKVILEIRRKR